MKFIVDEVKEDNQPIAIRIHGDDISFLATKNSLSIYLDEKTADGIAFQIQAILQDRERRMEELNVASQKV